MEHLPSGGHDLEIDVPYLCTERYECNGDWLGYPSKKGFELEHIRWRDFRRYPATETAAFLQNWLFFGLLMETLRCSVQTEDFIRRDAAGRPLITTRLLSKYLQEWSDRDALLSPELKRNALTQTTLNLQEARSLVYHLSEYGKSTRTTLSFSPVVPPEVALSLGLLGHALCVATHAILGSEGGSSGSLLRAVWATSDIFLDHMQSQGWCPYSTAEAEGETTMGIGYYAASFGPPRVKRNHRKCSENECVAIRFDERTYKTRHKTHGCRCPVLSLDPKEVAAHARGDKISLILFHPNSEGDGKTGSLEVVPWQPSMAYVAISHVWSDGLGNSSDNALPQCQIAELQEASNALYTSRDNPETDTRSLLEKMAKQTKKPQPIPFWIDTLCVVVGDRFERERKAAIKKMRQIYSNADKTLVLDSEVATCCVKSDPMEILFRILFSNWRRRLWTFQEGVLANSLHFLLRDGSISLLDFMEYNPPPSLAFNIWEGMMREFKNEFVLLSTSGLSALSKAQVSSDHNANASAAVLVINAISKRRTTRKSDEAVCSSTLLNIDSGLIIDAPTPLKMRTLITLLDKQIPPGLIFLNRPRLDQDGFRWAPKTFLAPIDKRRWLETYPLQLFVADPNPREVERPAGHLSPEGLVVMFPGIELKNISEEYSTESSVPESFLVDTSKGISGSRAGATDATPSVWRAIYSFDPTDPPWTRMAPQNYKKGVRLALIIGMFGPEWGSNASLLVKIKGESDDGRRIVRRICRVIVGATPTNEAWITDPWERLKGKWLPVTQKWAIGGEAEDEPNMSS